MAKSTHRHRSVYDFFVNSHKKKKCAIHTTSRTMKLVLPKSIHMVAESHLSFPEMGLMISIQKEAEQWMKKNEYYVEYFIKEDLKKKIKYKNISILCLKKNIEKTVHCMDLKSAYPTFMFNAGIISEKNYLKLREVPKERRMWIIGAMASTKFVTEYADGKKIIFTDENGREKDFKIIVKPTKILWQYIVFSIDRFMQSLFSEYRTFLDGYFSLAYYVDCLFILCDSSARFEAFIEGFSEKVHAEGFSYGYSQMILKNFEIDRKKIVLQDINDKEKTSTYHLSDNGFFVPSKIICND